MATVVVSKDDNLETFSIIWLDANPDIYWGTDVQKKLRNVINHLKHFNDEGICQQYIKQRSADERLVLIVNSQLGRQVVPCIHHLRQVTSIYVYCTDENMNEQWTNNFIKVRLFLLVLDM
jgi:hypothetical protein